MRALWLLLVMPMLSGCVGQFLTGELADPVPAPDFSVQDVDGETWNLTDLRGRVVLLDFMGTWCTPCQRAVPVLEDLQAAYPELVVLSVSSTDSEQKVQDFRTQHGAQWPHIVDGRLPAAYREAGTTAPSMMWPSYALVDQEGNLVFYNRGETLPSTFTAALDGLTIRQAPAVGTSAWGVAGAALVIGFLAWGSPFLQRHTWQRRDARPAASPLVGLVMYSLLGAAALWGSRPLSGRVATVAPFLVVAAVLALIYWKTKGTRAVQATGKRLDSDGPWRHTFGFWGTTVWYALPAWGVVLHAAMLRTAPMETLLLPISFGLGMALAEVVGRSGLRARVAAWPGFGARLGAAGLVLAAVWNGLLYLR